jgi:hypothetical protein
VLPFVCVKKFKIILPEDWSARLVVNAKSVTNCQSKKGEKRELHHGFGSEGKYL